MKSVFIAGSRRFSEDIKRLVELCKENEIKTTTAGKILNQEDTLESEKSALLRAFQRIDDSDILYIMANAGYTGKTVTLEVAYAFARNKEIISSEIIEDFSTRALVHKVMKPKILVEYIKQS